MKELKKISFEDFSMLKKINTMLKEGRKQPIRTWSRRSMILPLMVGFTFEVYNGRKFQSLFISEKMIGYKLGEFVSTRVYPRHPDLKKKKQESNQGGKR